MQKKVLIAGGSGFVGTGLGTAFVEAGWEVTVLSRSPDDHRGQLPFPAKVMGWNQLQQAVDDNDCVVNLCGSSIAAARWTKSKRQSLRRSRIEPTQKIVQAINQSKKPPSLLIQTSATGYYGDRKEEELTESSTRGQGFLSDLATAWEAESATDLNHHTRLVIARFGVVLDVTGGMLAALDTPLAMGLAPHLGSGENWLPWVHLDDLCAGLLFLANHQKASGVFNITAPQPVRFREFENELYKFYGSPLIPPVPAFVLRLAQGEASSLILDSCRALPTGLLECGFTFQYGDLSTALAYTFADKPRKRAWLFSDAVWVDVPVEEAFSFFAEAKNLQQITPPWLHFHIKGESPGPMAAGKEIYYQLKLKGLPMTWKTLISHWEENQQFVDEQVKGPYRFWHHRHMFRPLGSGTQIIDRVHYQLPMMPFGAPALPMVQKDVGKIFAYRRQTIASKFEANHTRN